MWEQEKGRKKCSYIIISKIKKNVRLKRTFGYTQRRNIQCLERESKLS